MFEEDKGISLLQALDDELSGDFKDGVMTLVKGQARMDAEVLYDSLTGVGTDEERLNEILTGRHPGQVEDIKAEYLKLGDNVTEQETLWDAVCSDTTFKYERFLKSSELQQQLPKPSFNPVADATVAADSARSRGLPRLPVLRGHVREQV